MINKKLPGILLAPLILGVIQAPAHADLSASASQTVQAKLYPYLYIEAITSGTTLLTNITPSNGNLQAPLVSKFRIRYNDGTQAQALYLHATTESSSSANEVAFFQQGGAEYIILSNLDNKPLSSAITSCKDPIPVTADNANAIAYPITSVVLDPVGTTPISFDNSKNQYDIEVEAGETIATTTIGATPFGGTFAFNDNAGTYQAILTLTTTSL